MSNKKSKVTSRKSYDSKLYAALAWLVIPAVIFLSDKKYAKDEFLIYNSYLSLAFAVASIGLELLLSLFFLFFLLPFAKFALSVAWVYGVYKAYNGEKVNLPIIADFAEKKTKEHIKSKK